MRPKNQPGGQKNNPNRDHTDLTKDMDEWSIGRLVKFTEVRKRLTHTHMKVSKTEVTQRSHRQEDSGHINIIQRL